MLSVRGASGCSGSQLEFAGSLFSVGSMQLHQILFLSLYLLTLCKVIFCFFYACFFFVALVCLKAISDMIKILLIHILCILSACECVCFSASVSLGALSAVPWFLLLQLHY